LRLLETELIYPLDALCVLSGTLILRTLDYSSILDSLEANSISVWVDIVGLNAGVNFLNKIGQAIIDSKVILALKINFHFSYRRNVCVRIIGSLLASQLITVGAD